MMLSRPVHPTAGVCGPELGEDCAYTGKMKATVLTTCITMAIATHHPGTCIEICTIAIVRQVFSKQLCFTQLLTDDVVFVHITTVTYRGIKKWCLFMGSYALMNDWVVNQ